MVVKLANELKAMISHEPMDVIDNNDSPPQILYSPPPTPPSVTSMPPCYDEIDTSRFDLLKGMYGLNNTIIKKWILITFDFKFKGFSLQLKADPHLDESIPISARDQHLLYNIFGDKWNDRTIVDAYIVVKGKTGYMSSWSPKDTKKSNGHHFNEFKH